MDKGKPGWSDPGPRNALRCSNIHVVIPKSRGSGMVRVGRAVELGARVRGLGCTVGGSGRELISGECGWEGEEE